MGQCAAKSRSPQNSPVLVNKPGALGTVSDFVLDGDPPDESPQPPGSDFDVCSWVQQLDVHTTRNPWYLCHSSAVRLCTRGPTDRAPVGVRFQMTADPSSGYLVLHVGVDPGQLAPSSFWTASVLLGNRANGEGKRWVNYHHQGRKPLAPVCSFAEVAAHLKVLFPSTAPVFWCTDRPELPGKWRSALEVGDVQNSSADVALQEDPAGSRDSQPHRSVPHEQTACSCALYLRLQSVYRKTRVYPSCSNSQGVDVESS